MTGKFLSMLLYNNGLLAVEFSGIMACLNLSKGLPPQNITILEPIRVVPTLGVWPKLAPYLSGLVDIIHKLGQFTLMSMPTYFKVFAMNCTIVRNKGLGILFQGMNYFSLNEIIL